MDKTTLYNACLQKLQEQIDELQAAIDKVQESVEGEQNSTVGNKFETARAMGQEELDRLNRQMSNAQNQRKILSLIVPNKACDTAQLGAVIQTNKKKLYFSIGLGKLEANGDTYFAISAASPIGKTLMGKTAGDTVEFASTKEKIEAIY
jgi:transcription elongation GreA/GreB family factor